MFFMLAALLFFTPALMPAQEASAQILPLPAEPFSGFQKPEGETGVDIAKSLAASIVDNVRFIIGAVAVLMIIISSIRLIIAEGDEETFKKQKSALIMAIIGLVLVGLSGEISQIFTVEKGASLRLTRLQRAMRSATSLVDLDTELLLTEIRPDTESKGR